MGLNALFFSYCYISSLIDYSLTTNIRESLTGDIEDITLRPHSAVDGTCLVYCRDTGHVYGHEIVDAGLQGH